MKKHTFAFLKLLVPLTIALCALHYALVTYVVTWYDFQLSIVAIYGFHFVLTFLIYFFLLYVSRTFFDRTGYAFMACSLLRMMASVVFLWPLIEGGDSFAVDVMAFFIPYFIYLTIEVLYVVKLMKDDNA